VTLLQKAAAFESSFCVVNCMMQEMFSGWLKDGSSGLPHSWRHLNSGGLLSAKLQTQADSKFFLIMLANAKDCRSKKNHYTKGAIRISSADE
jgi:trans-aconitate methyltransferase